MPITIHPNIVRPRVPVWALTKSVTVHASKLHNLMRIVGDYNRGLLSAEEASRELTLLLEWVVIFQENALVYLAPKHVPRIGLDTDYFTFDLDFEEQR